jgi:hypothetical protein
VRRVYKSFGVKRLKIYTLRIPSSHGIKKFPVADGGRCVRHPITKDNSERDE